MGVTVQGFLLRPGVLRRYFAFPHEKLASGSIVTNLALQVVASLLYPPSCFRGGGGQ